jgi:NADH-quinone oxidoreductase subunit F
MWRPKESLKSWPGMSEDPKRTMEKPLTALLRADGRPLGLEEYEKHGGYEVLKKVLRTMTPQEVQDAVKAANLRGRGGAGFGTGSKWSFVPMGESAPRPKFLICNSDEMEPGAFKDRVLMEGNPHQLIEGMIIAAYAIEASEAYVFLRWAYRQSAASVRGAIREAYEAGYVGGGIKGSKFSLDIRVHVSAGRYICGEETALLNALEGKRGTPRAKPPFPQASGLWGKPTVVNNTETLSNVPHILRNGAEWFKTLSRSTDGGTKIYTVSGRVKRPGYWELPMGTTIREIIEEHAGGMREGFGLRAVIPGGGSTDFVLPEHFDTPMDYESMPKVGSRLGTGTMIVLDDATCPVGMVGNIERFFARESCGWCTPCRDGLPWVARILESIEMGKGQEDDLEVLREHTWLLGMGHTYCAFAPGAVEPLQSALKFFGGDFERHIAEGGCTYKK